MIEVKIKMPEGVFAAMNKDPASFMRELRMAAAVKWYEMKLVSQGRAAEIAGISRSEFITLLGRFAVSAFQYDAAEVIDEAEQC